MPTGQFTAEPVTVTFEDGSTKTWVGRGRKPKWLSDYEAVHGAVRAAKKARNAADAV